MAPAPSPPTAAGPAAVQLGQLVDHVAPGYEGAKDPPSWPPDAFAIVAMVLERTGAYRRVVADWPPKFKGKGEWHEWIVEVGDRWREAHTAGEAPPPEVRRWWRVLYQARKLPLARVAGNAGLCDALLQTCAAADAASAGVGVPVGKGSHDVFWFEGRRRLTFTSDLSEPGGATLCSDRVAPWAARVLPKLHTPQSGITVRSLTHHLALSSASEVLPRWVMPLDFGARDDPRMLNILVVPEPMQVKRNQFEPVLTESDMPRNMPSGFGFFRFRKRSRPTSIGSRLKKLYAAATAEAGTIDLVVLPELALTANEFKAAREWARSENVTLISGVGRERGSDLPEDNLVSIELPFFSERTVPIEQSKHHRWRLTRSQIEAYGLGGHLSPLREWWEYTHLGDRSLYFAALLPWLTLCVLVCEDLAQQEPVANVVRTVGPNLVIAVLMDGPQFGGRWPGRYATVLADDPGSSVLTVTSLGMCERSVPPGTSPSRVVALWKDHRGQREIALGRGADGLLLNLLMETREEWSADGRSDGGSAGMPVLVGAYDIAL